MDGACDYFWAISNMPRTWERWGSCAWKRSRISSIIQEVSYKVTLSYMIISEHPCIWGLPFAIRLKLPIGKTLFDVKTSSESEEPSEQYGCVSMRRQLTSYWDSAYESRHIAFTQIIAPGVTKNTIFLSTKPLSQSRHWTMNSQVAPFCWL